MTIADNTRNDIIWIAMFAIVLLVIGLIFVKIKKNRKLEEKPILRFSLKTINKTKIIISSAAVIVVLLSVWLIHGAIQKVHEANRVPILQVVSRGTGIGIFSGNDYYYLVYDNGDYEEIDEFSVADVETYDLYLANNNSLDDAPPYAGEIIQYAKSIEHSEVNNLYVIDGRYFFDVHDNRMTQKKYQSTVFEYLPKQNDVKKIVQFKDHFTWHVELYSEAK